MPDVLSVKYRCQECGQFTTEAQCCGVDPQPVPVWYKSRIHGPDAAKERWQARLDGLLNPRLKRGRKRRPEPSEEHRPRKEPEPLPRMTPKTSKLYWSHIETESKPGATDAEKILAFHRWLESFMADRKSLTHPK
jgi:hypothetical protein